jgi:dimethylhistidine N-methyltransferase
MKATATSRAADRDLAEADCTSGGRHIAAPAHEIRDNEVLDTELEQLIAGLRQTPPRISPRYFYDGPGSRLFDQITGTPEYYPTRTELALLRERGGKIAERIASGCVLVELGSGSADKALALLDHLDSPRLYRPIDISREALDRTTRAVRRARPDLPVSPYWGDFAAEAAYADLPREAERLVYYSGSTIGNFEPAEAIDFLRKLRARLHPSDVLLLAADLVKDPTVLHAAYNDAQGVTAAFNKNLLLHLNARFGANFDPDAFEHRAFYEPRKRRIEMHLVPRGKLHVSLAGEAFRFEPSLPIHTESSHKFTLDDLPRLASSAGFTFEAVVTDERSWFAEALFRV